MKNLHGTVTKKVKECIGFCEIEDEASLNLLKLLLVKELQSTSFGCVKNRRKGFI